VGTPTILIQHKTFKDFFATLSSYRKTWLF